MTASAAFRSIVNQVESDLEETYGFVADAHAVDFLCDRYPLESSLAPRAAVIGVFGGDTADLGIFFDGEIVTQLENEDPRAALVDSNLDAFCALVEEISHFHLLVKRLTTERPVSQLELEWQGEVDKLLIATHYLSSQTHDAHVVPLARKLFDQAQIVGSPEERYVTANHLAARFWFAAIAAGINNESALRSPQFRRILRANYDASLAEKRHYSPGRGRLVSG